LEVGGHAGAGPVAWRRRPPRAAAHPGTSASTKLGAAPGVAPGQSLAAGQHPIASLHRRLERRAGRVLAVERSGHLRAHRRRPLREAAVALLVVADDDLPIIDR